MCGRKISKLRFSSQFLTLKTGRHKFSAIRTFRIFKNLVWDQLLRNKKGIFISKLYLFTDYVKRKCQIVVFFSIWPVSFGSIEFQSPKFDVGDCHFDAGHHHFLEFYLVYYLIWFQWKDIQLLYVHSMFKIYHIIWYIVLYTYDVIIMWLWILRRR